MKNLITSFKPATAALCTLALTSCEQPQSFQEQNEVGMCLWLADSYDQYSATADSDRNGTPDAFYKGIQKVMNGSKNDKTSPMRSNANQPTKQKLSKLRDDVKSCEIMLSIRTNYQRYNPQVASLDKFRKQIEQFYVSDEKREYLARTGGQQVCNGSLAEFIAPYSSTTPKKGCIYQGMTWLQAKQVTPDGILVGFIDPGANMIFLYKGNPIDNEVADGASIQTGNFAYVGLYPYQSMTGPRTIYAFRRVDMKNLTKGLQFYDGRN